MEQEDERYSKVALLALITGIASAPPLGLLGGGVLAPVAIISGVIGLGILDRDPSLKGRQWCWAGIVGGTLFLIFILIIAYLFSQMEPWE